jgi:hypothetical protein
VAESVTAMLGVLELLWYVRSILRSFFADSDLFLPLVWPHGSIGRLGGPRRPGPQNWPLTRDSGGGTA